MLEASETLLYILLAHDCARSNKHTNLWKLFNCCLGEGPSLTKNVSQRTFNYSRYAKRSLAHSFQLYNIYFQGETAKEPKGKERAKGDSLELPSELNFFKYAQGETTKRKSRSSHHDEEDNDEEEEQQMKKAKSENTHSSNSPRTSGPSVPRQRVTAKGTSVPTSIESFEDLKTRFDVSSHILSNLEQSGYQQPTGIQAHGIPILLEVRYQLVVVSIRIPQYVSYDMQSRDLVAISPTGTGKTLAYLLPIMSFLGSPSSGTETSKGVRAVILAPTRELAHQIHNECLKLAQGRKWRIILFSKATASTLVDKSVRDKVGKYELLEFLLHSVLICRLRYRYQYTTETGLCITIRGNRTPQVRFSIGVVYERLTLLN